MSSAIFSPSKTHPVAGEMPAAWTNTAKDPNAMHEIVIECQQINLVENPLRLQPTTVSTVGNYAVHSNQLPPIELNGIAAVNDANALRPLSQTTIKVPSDLRLSRGSVAGVSAMTTGTVAREWKRDKTFDGCPIFCLGEKGSGIRCRSNQVQNFSQLRSLCMEKNQLFEDVDFPAIDESLQFSAPLARDIVWLRPTEIVSEPKFFAEGISRFDVRQGELGDCWLLAAIASLTQDLNVFHRVVPDEQGFDKNYSGIFHFRFWQYGRWIDVVIDDRLPTYNGQLLYMHSTEKNEFWSALLEKAYAKLHGSYEALKGGTACEAMEDFTGGVTELYELKDAPANLFSILLKAVDRDSMLGCSIEADPATVEAVTADGLIKGHAYTITEVKMIDIRTPNKIGKLPMLRLRNPWGNEAEWTGPWSDRSAEWRFIDDETRTEIGLTFASDGEFWMSFADWLKHFDRVELCNLTPDSLSEEQIQAGKKRWEMTVMEGEWTKGITAGGCRNNLDSFWRNPQYVVTIDEQDDDDDDGKCTIIVALMQKHRRANRRMGLDTLSIGFAVYAVTPADLDKKPLAMDFFKFNASVARSPSYINLREVSCRFQLPIGHYLIVPTTFAPDEEAEFLIRIFSEKQNFIEENDETIGEIPEDSTADDHLLPMDILPVDIDDIFNDLCGDDLEIDAYELKQILDKLIMNNHLWDGFGAISSDASPKPSILHKLLYCLCVHRTPPVVGRLHGKTISFSPDVCRSMVAMLDTDQSGKLGLLEIKQLLHNIFKWNAVFRTHDTDKSGHLSAAELRTALNAAGFKLNNRLLTALCHRYGGRDGTITFVDFITCAVKIKTMLDIFKNRDVDGLNVTSFTVDEWMAITIY